MGHGNIKEHRFGAMLFKTYQGFLAVWAVWTKYPKSEKNSLMVERKSTSSPTNNRENESIQGVSVVDNRIIEDRAADSTIEASIVSFR